MGWLNRLLFLISCTCGQDLTPPDRAPSRTVIKNDKVQVKIGRRAYISPTEHLSLSVEYGHNCEVRVLFSPTEQTAGELNVDRFPCDFTEEELVYQHFGRGTPASDRISLLVLYDTPTEKKVLPIQLEIEVIMPPYEIVDNQQMVNVYQNMGDSEIIDSSILSFNYDKNVADCFVRIPNPYQPNERFFIKNSKQLSANYPAFQGRARNVM